MGGFRERGGGFRETMGHKRGYKCIMYVVFAASTGPQGTVAAESAAHMICFYAILCPMLSPLP